MSEIRVYETKSGVSAGCLGMSLGEVRKLDIPADEGYGANGSPTLLLPSFLERASCDPIK